MLPSKKDIRQFIVKVNDKQTSKKVPIVANQNRLNEEIYFNNNRSPPIVFNRSNSSLKRSENTDQAIKSYKQNFEEKDHNKIIMRKYTDDINKAASLPEITEKDIITSHLYQDLKKKYQEEKDRTLKMKRLLHEKDSEITTHKQDKLQMYNKIAMMEEQIRNYEVAFEERKNNVEVAFPDFQSLLLALRYSGGHNLIRSRTPVREEMNPDHMTYEELIHLEEQIGNVNRGFTEQELTMMNNFIFNSKFNPNCNHQDSCTICCSEFAVGNKLNKLNCGHVYHNNCIRPWLLKEKTCPICKSTVIL